MYLLKKEIMHVYGTLDFRIEPGAIVDEPSKAVANYISKKLQKLIRLRRK